MKNTGTSCIQPSYALWMEFCKENGVIHGSSLRHLLFTYVSLECIYTYNLSKNVYPQLNFKKYLIIKY